ncbi:MAG: hypothetical protein LBP51_00680 [Deferribacteraceae bacterium]|jgi:hypothetical protein|nr:hypothetical protein [Deferribacteraceae bacterium]
MNYTIHFCSKLSSAFDTVMKLAVETASEADYATKIYTSQSYSPFSSIMLDIHFIGSAKKKAIEAVLDFDGVYIGKSVSLYISPKIIDIAYDGLHYWGIAGTLFKIIGDLSPALITSYLLKTNRERELSVFKQFSLKSLPLSIQETLALMQKEAELKS